MNIGVHHYRNLSPGVAPYVAGRILDDSLEPWRRRGATVLCGDAHVGVSDFAVASIDAIHVAGRVLEISDSRVILVTLNPPRHFSFARRDVRLLRILPWDDTLR